MGILFIRHAWTPTINWPTLSYYSISLSLNIILTLMIVIRLVLLTRNTRAAMGVTGTGGLHSAIITMLVESCALYAVGSLPVIGAWAAGHPITSFFVFILPQTQVSLSHNHGLRTGFLMDGGLNRSSLRCSSFNESPKGLH